MSFLYVLAIFYALLYYHPSDPFCFFSDPYFPLKIFQFLIYLLDLFVHAARYHIGEAES